MRRAVRTVPGNSWPILWLVVWCFAALPVLAAEPARTYRYVDDAGVMNYTDRWDAIPERYRSRSQVLDPAGAVVPKGGPRAASPGAAQPPAPSPDRAPASADRPFYAAWLDTVSRTSLPLPPESRWIVATVAALLVVGAVLLIRRSANLVARLLLKALIILALIGGAYVIYLTALSEGIFGDRKARSVEGVAGKGILQDLQGTAQRAKGIIQENAVAPLERATDMTIGEAARTRDLANQSSREKVKALKEIGAGP